VWLAAAGVASGIGLGLAAPASSNAGLQLAPDHVSAVSGLRGMFRQSGGLACVAVLTTVASVGSVPGGAQAIGQLALAGLLVVVVPLILRLPNHRGSW
jgi:hypothetical protein